MDAVARLARRVKSVADAELRAGYVRATLRELAPDALADLLALVLARVEARDEDHEALWRAAVVALASAELDAVRREAATIAQVRGDHELAGILVRDGLSATEEAAAQLVYTPGERPLSLGERKSLARRPRRDVLLKALRDPHPDVIRILLGNPHVTEDDIVRLCARRPIAETVLREVARSTRFVARERVRLALVKNPYTPLDVALPLVAGLPSPHARAIAESPGLALPLREAARRIAFGATIH